MATTDGGHPHLVPVQGQGIQGSENRKLHRILEERCCLLCPHPQLFPTVLRLFQNQPRKQKTRLRNRIQNRRTVRRHSRLPDGGGHGRHGQRLQGGPQDDLLLRPRGLPDVQRNVKTFHTLYKNSSSNSSHISSPLYTRYLSVIPSLESWAIFWPV